MAQKTNRSIKDFFRPAASRQLSLPVHDDSPAVVQQPEISPVIARPLTSVPVHDDDSTVAQDSESSPVVTRPLTSSFSSLPRSSQSTSKRVISHGEEVVKGSDSEMDDSDSSLPELSSLLNKKRRVSKPAHTPAPTTSTSNTAPKKKYTFSLDALVEEEKKAAAMEARIEAAQSKLQVKSTGLTSQRGQDGTREVVMASLVEHGDIDDEGRARRVKEAFSRTEALELNEVWHFFKDHLPERQKHSFPEITVAKSSLATMLNDPARRQQAFVTGFLPRLSTHTELPEELLLWLMDEVCTEPKETLVRTYISVLEGSLSTYKDTVSTARLESLFKQLGIKETVLSPHYPVIASKEPDGFKRRPISASFLHLVDFLGRIADIMPPGSRERAIHLLALACFDDSVLLDGNLRIKIEESTTLLLTSVPEPEFEELALRLSTTLFETIMSPALRYQLISSLPCCTARTHLFRRRLALAFALNSSRHLTSSMDNSKLMSHVLLSLRESKIYAISRATNYVDMGACFSMLDVAIDVGFSDFDFTEKPSAEISSGNLKEKFYAPRRLLNKNKEGAKEKAFNEDVDIVAKEIRSIMAHIVDSGASHMRRTECKATATRLAQRLECGVRSREKAATDYYKIRDVEEGKALMESFVKTEVKGKKIDDVVMAEGEVSMG